MFLLLQKCFQNKQHISVVVLYTCTFSYSRGKQISWILPLFANFFLQQLEWTITNYLQQLFGDLNAQQKLDNNLTIIISIKEVNWILHCQWILFLFLTWLGLLEILTESCLLQFNCRTNVVLLSSILLWHSESPCFASLFSKTRLNNPNILEHEYHCRKLLKDLFLISSYIFCPFNPIWSHSSTWINVSRSKVKVITDLSENKNHCPDHMFIYLSPFLFMLHMRGACW